MRNELVRQAGMSSVHLSECLQVPGQRLHSAFRFSSAFLFFHFPFSFDVNLTLKSSTDRVLSAHTKTKWIGHNPQPMAAVGAHTSAAAVTDIQMDNLKDFVQNNSMIPRKKESLQAPFF